MCTETGTVGRTAQEVLLTFSGFSLKKRQIKNNKPNPIKPMKTLVILFAVIVLSASASLVANNNIAAPLEVLFCCRRFFSLLFF